MGFAEAVRTCLRKYVGFSGRATRPEYWWFLLFVVLAGAAASVVDALLFPGAPTPAPADTAEGAVGAAQTAARGPINEIVSLGLFLPHLAAAWRRMHDTGRPGYMVLLPTILILSALAVLIFGVGMADLFASGGNLDILFTRATLIVVIPTLVVLILSPLIVLWWLARPSQPGPNAYGPNPHEVAQ